MQEDELEIVERSERLGRALGSILANYRDGRISECAEALVEVVGVVRELDTRAALQSEPEEVSEAMLKAGFQEFIQNFGRISLDDNLTRTYLVMRSAALQSEPQAPTEEDIAQLIEDELCPIFGAGPYETLAKKIVVMRSAPLQSEPGEVSEAMIEAGMDEYYSHDVENEGTRTVLTRVYLTMRSAALQSDAQALTGAGELTARDVTDDMLNAGQSRLCELRCRTFFDDELQAEIFAAMFNAMRSAAPRGEKE